MYWPENYISIYLIDGSFFVPYFTLFSLFNFSNKDRCTACLYGMVSRIIMLSQLALPRCFPKASAKVRQIFEPANFFEDFFKKSREKIKHTGKICANTINPRQINDKNHQQHCRFVLSKALFFLKANKATYLIARLK